MGMLFARRKRDDQTNEMTTIKSLSQKDKVSESVKTQPAKNVSVEENKQSQPKFKV